MNAYFRSEIVALSGMPKPNVLPVDAFPSEEYLTLHLLVNGVDER